MPSLPQHQEQHLHTVKHVAGQSQNRPQQVTPPGLLVQQDFAQLPMQAQQQKVIQQHQIPSQHHLQTPPQHPQQGQTTLQHQQPQHQPGRLQQQYTSKPLLQEQQLEEQGQESGQSVCFYLPVSSQSTGVRDVRMQEQALLQAPFLKQQQQQEQHRPQPPPQQGHVQHEGRSMRVQQEQGTSLLHNESSAESHAWPHQQRRQQQTGQTAQQPEHPTQQQPKHKPSTAAPAYLPTRERLPQPQLSQQQQLQYRWQLLHQRQATQYSPPTHQHPCLTEHQQQVKQQLKCSASARAPVTEGRASILGAPAVASLPRPPPPHSLTSIPSFPHFVPFSAVVPFPPSKNKQERVATPSAAVSSPKAASPAVASPASALYGGAAVPSAAAEYLRASDVQRDRPAATAVAMAAPFASNSGQGAINRSTSREGRGMKAEKGTEGAVDTVSVAAAKTRDTESTPSKAERGDGLTSLYLAVPVLSADVAAVSKDNQKGRREEKEGEYAREEGPTQTPCSLPGACSGDDAPITRPPLVRLSSATGAGAVAVAPEANVRQTPSDFTFPNPAGHDRLGSSAAPTRAPGNMSTPATAVLTPAISVSPETTAATPLGPTKLSALSSPAAVTPKHVTAPAASHTVLTSLPPGLFPVDALAVAAGNPVVAEPASLTAAAGLTKAAAAEAPVSTLAGVATLPGPKVNTLSETATPACLSTDTAAVLAAAVDPAAAAATATLAPITIRTLAEQTASAKRIQAERLAGAQQRQRTDEQRHISMMPATKAEPYTQPFGAGVGLPYTPLPGNDTGGCDYVLPSIALPSEPRWRACAQEDCTTAEAPASSVLHARDCEEQEAYRASAYPTSTVNASTEPNADRTWAPVDSPFCEAVLPPGLEGLFGKGSSISAARGSEGSMTGWWCSDIDNSFSLKAGVCTKESNQPRQQKQQQGHSEKEGRKEQPVRPDPCCTFYDNFQEQQMWEQPSKSVRKQAHEQQEVQYLEQQAYHQRLFSVPRDSLRVGSAAHRDSRSDDSRSSHRDRVASTTNTELGMQRKTQMLTETRKRVDPLEESVAEAPVRGKTSESRVDGRVKVFFEGSGSAAGETADRRKGEFSVRTKFPVNRGFLGVTEDEGRNSAAAAAAGVSRGCGEYQRQRVGFMQFAKQKQVEEEQLKGRELTLSEQLEENLIPGATSDATVPIYHMTAEDDEMWVSCKSRRRRSRSRARQPQQREHKQDQVPDRRDRRINDVVHRMHRHSYDCCGGGRYSSRSAIRRDHSRMCKEGSSVITSGSSSSRYISSTSSEGDEYYYCRGGGREPLKDREYVTLQGDLEQHYQRQPPERTYSPCRQTHLRRQHRHSRQHSKSSRRALKESAKLKKQLRAAVEATLVEHNSAVAAAALSAAYSKLIETLDGGEEQQRKTQSQQQPVGRSERQDLQLRQHQDLRDQQRLRRLRLPGQVAGPMGAEQRQTKLREEDFERILQTLREEPENDKEEEERVKERQQRRGKEPDEGFCESIYTHRLGENEGSRGGSGRKDTSESNTYGRSRRSDSLSTLQNASGGSSNTAGSSDNYGKSSIQKDEGLFRLSIRRWGAEKRECGEQQGHPQQLQADQQQRGRHCDLWVVKPDSKGGFLFEKETPEYSSHQHSSPRKKEIERGAAEALLNSQKYTAPGGGEDIASSSSSSTAATNRSVYEHCLQYPLMTAIPPAQKLLEPEAASTVDNVRAADSALSDAGPKSLSTLKDSSNLEAEKVLAAAVRMSAEADTAADRQEAARTSKPAAAVRISREADTAADGQKAARASRTPARATLPEGSNPDSSLRQTCSTFNDPADPFYEGKSNIHDNSHALGVSSNAAPDATKAGKVHVPLLQLGALQRRCAAAAEAASSLAFCGQHSSLHPWAGPGSSIINSIHTGKPAALTEDGSRGTTAAGLRAGKAGKEKDEAKDASSPLISYRDLLLNDDLTPKINLSLSTNRARLQPFQGPAEFCGRAPVANSAALASAVKSEDSNKNQSGAPTKASKPLAGAERKTSSTKKAEAVAKVADIEQTREGKQARTQKEAKSLGVQKEEAVSTGKTSSSVGKAAALTAKESEKSIPGGKNSIGRTAVKKSAVEKTEKTLAETAQPEDDAHKAITVTEKKFGSPERKESTKQDSLSELSSARTKSTAARIPQLSTAASEPAAATSGAEETAGGKLQEEESTVAGDARVKVTGKNEGKSSMQGLEKKTVGEHKGAAATGKLLKPSTVTNTSADKQGKRGTGTTGSEMKKLQPPAASSAPRACGEGVVSAGGGKADAPAAKPCGDNVCGAKAEAAPARAKEARPAVSIKGLSNTAVASTLTSDKRDRLEGEQRHIITTQKQSTQICRAPAITATERRAMVPPAAAAALSCASASAALLSKGTEAAGSRATASAAPSPSVMPSTQAPCVSSSSSSSSSSAAAAPTMQQDKVAGEVVAIENSGTLAPRSKGETPAANAGEESERKKTECQLGEKNDIALADGKEGTSQIYGRGRERYTENKKTLPVHKKVEQLRRSWKAVGSSPASKDHHLAASSLPSSSSSSPSSDAGGSVVSGVSCLTGASLASSVSAASKQVTAQPNGLNSSSAAAATADATGAPPDPKTAGACAVRVKDGKASVWHQERKHQVFQATPGNSCDDSSSCNVNDIKEKSSEAAVIMQRARGENEADGQGSRMSAEEEGKKKKDGGLVAKQESSVCNQTDKDGSQTSMSNILGGIGYSNAFPPLSVSSLWSKKKITTAPFPAHSTAGDAARAAGEKLGDANRATTRGRARGGEVFRWKAPGGGKVKERPKGKKECHPREARGGMTVGGARGTYVKRGGRSTTAQQKYGQTAATGRAADILSGASYQRRRNHTVDLSGSSSFDETISRSSSRCCGAASPLSSVESGSPAALLAPRFGTAVAASLSLLTAGIRAGNGSIGGNNVSTTGACKLAALTQHGKRTCKRDNKRYKHASAVGPAAVATERGRERMENRRNRGEKNFLKSSEDKRNAKLFRGETNRGPVTEAGRYLDHMKLSNGGLQRGQQQEHGKYQQERTVHVPSSLLVRTDKQTHESRKQNLPQEKVGRNKYFLRIPGSLSLQQPQPEGWLPPENPRQRHLLRADGRASKGGSENLQRGEGIASEKRKSCRSNSTKRSNSRGTSCSRREWEALEEAIAVAAAAEAKEAAARAELEGTGKWSQIPTAAYLNKAEDVQESELCQQYMLQYMLLLQQRRHQQQQHGPGEGTAASQNPKSFSAAAAADSDFVGDPDGSNRESWFSIDMEDETDGDEEDDMREVDTGKMEKGTKYKGGKQKWQVGGTKKERCGVPQMAQQQKPKKKQKKDLFSAAANIISVVTRIKVAAETTAHDRGVLEEDEVETQDEEEKEEVENFGCRNISTAVALEAHKKLQKTENVLVPPRLLLHPSAGKHLSCAVEAAMDISDAVYRKALRKEEHQQQSQPQQQQQHHQKRGKGISTLALEAGLLAATKEGPAERFVICPPAALENKNAANSGLSPIQEEATQEEKQSPTGELTTCAYVLYWPTAVEHIKPFLDAGIQQKTSGRQCAAKDRHREDSIDGASPGSVACRPTSLFRQTQVRELPAAICCVC